MGDFCRNSSLGAQEPLAGTAPQNTPLWLFVEDPQPWGAKVPRDSGLPPVAKEALAEFGQAVPGLRVQLIRRPGTVRDGSVQVFVARTTPGREKVVRLALPSAEDLVELSLEGALGGMYEAEVVETPLYFVCTHGTRDRCCAKWGMPVYQALAERVGDKVWQTSHLGGHRFAATLLTLPFGLVYGRVEASEAALLAEATGRGEIYDLARLRGRSAYPRPAQAAECLVREREGDKRAMGLTLEALDALGPTRWQARFSRAGEVDASIEIEQKALKIPCIGSCGDAEPERFPVYRAIG